WAYSMSGERHKFEKQAKDADDKVKAARKAEEWALLQAYEWKNMIDPAVLGDKSTEFEQWKNLRGEVVSDDGPCKIKEGSRFDTEKDKDAVFELMKNARKDLNWNKQTHRYVSAYGSKNKALDEEVIKERTGRYTELVKQGELEQKDRNREARFE